MAGVQRARARDGRGPADAAARASTVPRDLRLQPGRVLHGACRGPQAAHHRRLRRARRHRHERHPPDRGDRRAGARAHGPSCGRLRGAGAARAGERGHHSGALRAARRRREGPPAQAVPVGHLPRAHAARGGPGAPVPLHLRALAQPRGRDPRPRHRQGVLRARQGSRDPAAIPVRGRRRPRGPGDRRLLAVRRAAQLRPARGRDRRASRLPLPRHGGGRSLHLPRHAQRGRRGRGGRCGEPPQGDGEGAAAPQVRPCRAPRGGG